MEAVEALPALDLVPMQLHQAPHLTPVRHLLLPEITLVALDPLEATAKRKRRLPAFSADPRTALRTRTAAPT